MTARGKPGKPKAGFPPFPPSLESPQRLRASHIPTASTADPYIKGRTKQGRPYGRALKPSTRRVGQNKLPKWAKSSCQTHGCIRFCNSGSPNPNQRTINGSGANLRILLTFTGFHDPYSKGL